LGETKEQLKSSQVEKRRFNTENSTQEFVANSKPTYARVDPYNKRITLIQTTTMRWKERSRAYAFSTSQEDSVVRHRSHFVVAPVLLILIFPVFATGQAKEGAWSKKKSPWVSLSAAERTQVQDFSEDYKQYLDVARSALGSTKERNSRQASWLRCP